MVSPNVKDIMLSGRLYKLSMSPKQARNTAKVLGINLYSKKENNNK